MRKEFPYYHGHYERIAEYTPEEVLPYHVPAKVRLDMVKSGVKKKSPEFKEMTERDYEGHMVKMTSQRYEVFATMGLTCVECGLEGVFFALEKQVQQDSDRYHFNLYGYDEEGNEVMLTKDHIVPKSKGGKNFIKNYQTMCYNCNAEKADTV